MGLDMYLEMSPWLLQGHEWEQKIWSPVEMSELGCRMLEHGRNRGAGRQSLVVGSGWALPYSVLPGRGEALM